MSQTPLSDIRVLDLTRLLPGPYCSLLLAHLGAEVIKVETPRIGDYSRYLPPEIGGDALFASVNRGKKSVALNYRNPRGRQLLLELVQTADVFLEGFRPGRVGHWEIGYDDLRSSNPRLIYCSLSGYGQQGPYSQRAGHDLNYIAAGGLLGLNGSAGGPPIPPSAQIADLAGGMLAAIAILAALLRRERTGRGEYLDVALLDAVVSWAMPMATSGYLRGGPAPERGRMPLAGGLPCYNVYRTSDGGYLALGALEPPFWSAFCQASGHPELLGRQFDYEAIPLVAELFATRSQTEWFRVLGEQDACLEPVLSIPQMAAHPQVVSRGLVIPPGEPSRENRAALGSPLHLEGLPRLGDPPALGAQTRELLGQLGSSPEELEELEARGIIRSG
jgi:crotonobetainyl-CoA:carnitine CoA-transferase CaiB-like acyl-CoA transferase